VVLFCLFEWYYSLQSNMTVVLFREKTMSLVYNLNLLVYFCFCGTSLQTSALLRIIWVLFVILGSCFCLFRGWTIVLDYPNRVHFKIAQYFCLILTLQLR